MTITDEMISAAADAVDNDKEEENTTTTATSTTTDKDCSDNDGEPTTIKNMISTINKHSDGTNVIKESIITFRSSDGSDEKDDVIVPASNDGKEDKAMLLMKQMIEKDKESVQKKKHKKKKKNPFNTIWDFRTSPHEQFGKTLEDTFYAFLVWAKTKSKTSSKNDDKNEDDNKDNNGVNDDGSAAHTGNSSSCIINVSKAFRRLKSYAQWMEETENDLVEPPLTADSIQEGLDAWAMRTSYSNNSGELLWWIDFATMDKDAFKHKLTPEQSIRVCVWYCHAVLYDPQAQIHGLSIYENVNKAGFFEMMTLVPMKVGAKLDRLTIGILPIRMNKMYVFETPRWMNLFMKFMGAFMSKKMKQRIVIGQGNDWRDTIEQLVGGKDCIPKGFGGNIGTLEGDPVIDKYFSS